MSPVIHSVFVFLEIQKRSSFLDDGAGRVDNRSLNEWKKSDILNVQSTDAINML